MLNNCKEDINLAYRNMDSKPRLDKVQVNNRTHELICFCYGVKEIKISLDPLDYIYAIISKREFRL